MPKPVAGAGGFQFVVGEDFKEWIQRLRLTGYHRKNNKVLDALAQDWYIFCYLLHKIYVHKLITVRRRKRG
jgi:hypothetical protein